MTKTAVYRHFDADGALLYVGISACPANRFTSHKSNSCWAIDTASMTMEWFDTRREAFDAEQAAIATEKPVHNVPRKGSNAPHPCAPVTGGAA